MMHYKVEKLFAAIEHGDEKHRAWLREKLEAWSRDVFEKQMTEREFIEAIVALGFRSDARARGAFFKGDVGILTISDRAMIGGHEVGLCEGEWKTFDEVLVDLAKVRL